MTIFSVRRFALAATASAVFTGVATGAYYINQPATYWRSVSSDRVRFKPQPAPDLSQYFVTRSVASANNSKLNFTLFQYQNCPFCTKVRTFLDFYGFQYDVIEVDPLRQTQLKWNAGYKKVPVLVVKSGEESTVLLDSSVINSVITSYLLDQKQSIQKLTGFYPGYSEGKKVEWENKYSIMHLDRTTVDRTKDVQETKWRRWVDDRLVHAISPNIYRTWSEAVATFRYFDECGDYQKSYSGFNRSCMIYAGGSVMWLVSKKLKKKYKLDSDVRVSLYGICSEFTSQLDRQKTQFLGGSEPSLADLETYACIRTFEGLSAFTDLSIAVPRFATWYSDVSGKLESRHGATLGKFKS